MEKIYLEKEEKAIIFALRDKKYKENGVDIYYLNRLHDKGLISYVRVAGPSYIGFTDDGKEYLKRNPKLKNPSIWDDKKYIINTAISVTAIIISAIALYFSIKNN